MTRNKKRSQIIWLNLSELGTLYAISGIKMGKLLTDLGLRENLRPSKAAIEFQMVKQKKLSNGATGESNQEFFWLWDKDKTISFLSQKSHIIKSEHEQRFFIRSVQIRQRNRDF